MLPPRLQLVGDDKEVRLTPQDGEPLVAADEAHGNRPDKALEKLASEPDVVSESTRNYKSVRVVGSRLESQ